MGFKGIAAVLTAAASLVAAVGALRFSKDANARSGSTSAQTDRAFNQADQGYAFLMQEMKELRERVAALEGKGAGASGKPSPPRPPRSLPTALKDVPRVSAPEDQTDRTGGDYSGFDILDADPDKCSHACVLDPQCRAFTYARPGFVNGPRSPAHCFLKSSVMSPVKKACCISGTVSRG